MLLYDSILILYTTLLYAFLYPFLLLDSLLYYSSITCHLCLTLLYLLSTVRVVFWKSIYIGSFSTKFPFAMFNSLFVDVIWRHGSSVKTGDHPQLGSRTTLYLRVPNLTSFFWYGKMMEDVSCIRFHIKDAKQLPGGWNLLCQSISIHN